MSCNLMFCWYSGLIRCMVIRRPLRSKYITFFKFVNISGVSITPYFVHVFWDVIRKRFFIIFSLLQSLKHQRSHRSKQKLVTPLERKIIRGTILRKNLTLFIVILNWIITLVLTLHRIVKPTGKHRIKDEWVFLCGIPSTILLHRTFPAVSFI